jgi:hypothetical protein
MNFWLGMLQNLGRRAKALNDRLSNEINLVSEPWFGGRILILDRASTLWFNEIVEKQLKSAERRH